jgi:uncharacterized protein (TIGR02271 family)
MFDRMSVREGMIVYSSDGEKLGKVLACDAASFIIEKGFFFPKDYVARYEDVADITGDEIRLLTTKDALPRGAAERGYGATETAREEVSVPVAEEEIDVEKRQRHAGEVRLRKDVVTEKKHIEVPVTREEVTVEHVRTDQTRAASPGEGVFEEQTVSMPVTEEEVEIRKRPVVKEEVRLRKDRTVEQRATEEDVRKERVDVERSGRVVRDDDGLD